MVPCYWWIKIYKYNNGKLNQVAWKPYKFRTKNWIYINDDSSGTYNTNNRIKFKSQMLKSKLCDFSDAYILIKGTITLIGQGVNVTADRNNK